MGESSPNKRRFMAKVWEGLTPKVNLKLVWGVEVGSRASVLAPFPHVTVGLWALLEPLNRLCHQKYCSGLASTAPLSA